MSTGDGFYHHHRSWADDLTVPFTALPRYVAQVRSGTLSARPTEELRAERERIASEYRSLLSSSEEQAAFDQMLGLCRRVFPFVEDHKFYCEHWFTSQFFGKIREFGALLARFGVLAEAEDVFQLHHTEVDQALSDVMLAWAAGGPPLGGVLLEADRCLAQADAGRHEGVVAAARAGAGAHGVERSRRAHAVGRDPGADRGLAFAVLR